VTAPPTTLPDVGGLDLSLTATALAWPDGTVGTRGAAGLTNDRIAEAQRAAGLEDLAVTLANWVGSGPPGATDPPRLVLVEALPSARTSVDPERCHVWWRVVHLLTVHGVPILVVQPSVVKLYACGMGNANKREVIAGIAEWFPAFEIHRTSKAGKVLTTYDDNKADAVALMALGCELLGEPLVELPAKHRKALDKLELPPGVRA